MKPMLAATIDDLTQLYDRWPLLASPKLDGIRAIKWDGKIVSRNLKPIPNKHVQSLFECLPHGLDGELIVGEPTNAYCMRDTNSGCMAIEGTPNVFFYAFDFISVGYTFKERQKFMQRWSDTTPDSWKEYVKFVPQKTIHSASELSEYEARVLELGFEGVMLRSMDGFYKFGRSTMTEGYLMKLKQFKDSEAEVIAVEELMHNNNEQTKDELGRSKRSTHKENLTAGGTLGSLHVRDIYTGVSFSVGSGFTQEDRDALWAERTSLKGRLVKYKYFPTGSKDKPRFPVFLGFRDKIDV